MSFLDIRPSELPDNIGRIALDTETGTIDDPEGALFPDDGARVADVSIAWHDRDGEPISCAWRFWDEGGHGGALDRAEWDYLCEWVAARPGIAYMNAPMDVGSMYAGTGNGFPGVDLLDNATWDIGLVSSILDPGELVSLDKQAARNFGTSDKAAALAPLKKWLATARREIAKPRHAENRRRRKEGEPELPTPPEELRYQTWAYYLAPWELVRPYAATDAELTIRIARLQWLRLQEGEGGPKRWQFVEQDLEVMRTLIRMERRGVPFDHERSAEVALDLMARREEALARLPFGEPTPTNLHHWFFEVQKVTPLKVSAKTKKPSLDAESVEHLAQAGVPGSAELTSYRRIEGALIRWYEPFARMTNKADGRLRPRYKQTAVRSGRLSIQRAQLQAVPHNHVLRNTPELGQYPTPRDLIRPEPGWAIHEMDLAQAELRVAAWFAVAKNMLAIIGEGRDPHGELATTAFGVKKGDDDFFQFRQVSKRGNFSLIFGIGRDKLRADIKTQTGLVLPWDEVDNLRDTFRDMHPEFGRAIKTESRRALMNYDHRSKTSHVTLVTGRKNGVSSFEMDRDWDEELDKPVGPVKGMHKAFNRKVQGSIGEFAKAWMVLADAYLMDALQEVDPEGRHGLLIQIHDALVISVPEGEWGNMLAKQVRQLGIDLWDQWWRRPTGDGGELFVPGDIDLNVWNQK